MKIIKPIIIWYFTRKFKSVDTSSESKNQLSIVDGSVKTINNNIHIQELD